MAIENFESPPESTGENVNDPTRDPSATPEPWDEYMIDAVSVYHGAPTVAEIVRRMGPVPDDETAALEEIGRRLHRLHHLGVYRPDARSMASTQQISTLARLLYRHHPEVFRHLMHGFQGGETSRDSGA